MDFLKLAAERYSVRAFQQKAVEEETLLAILEAGRLAPTARNLQPQRVLVLRSEEALEKLKRCTQCHYQAPLALIICADEAECWKRSYDGCESAQVDASIVCDHMMLAASSLGVGSTWVMFFDPAAVKREFGLPEQELPVAILVMGYAADGAQPSDRHASRKALAETVRFL